MRREQQAQRLGGAANVIHHQLRAARLGARAHRRGQDAHDRHRSVRRTERVPGANGKTIRGITPEFGEAIAQELGLQAKLVAAPFDSIIAGLTSPKYDLGMSAFTDTEARERVVDFVDYSFAGT